MTDQRLTLGMMGENLALAYLKNLGYSILLQNYRVQFGEIDIVAEDSGTLVFVEVKTRQGKSFGSPFDSITFRKQRQLSKVALEFIGKHGLENRPARFDVVSVLFEKNFPSSEATAKVEVLTNAFDLNFGV